MKSRLVVNCGGMFSGKSTELMRQGERHMIAGHNVVFVKPLIDNRYSNDEIVNHKGQKVQAINIKHGKELLVTPSILKADVVLIDEVQFIPKVVESIKDLLTINKMIYCSGLDMDYKGDPFEAVACLMAMAEEINKFHAVCNNCGEDALFSHKTIESNQRIELGEKDIYIPLCRKCYQSTKE